MKNTVKFKRSSFSLLCLFLCSIAIYAQNGSRVFENNLWYSTNKVNSIQYKGSGISVPSFSTQIGEINTISSDPLFVNPSQGDFRLQESSPAKGTGHMGTDLGTYAVYGKTEVGFDETIQLTNAVGVELNSIISTASRGGVVNIVVSLNKLTDKPISADLKPIAGDARQGVDFTPESQVINFGVGETRKTISVSFQETAEHDQLEAFRLDNAVNAQICPKNMHLVRIKKN